MKYITRYHIHVFTALIILCAVNFGVHGVNLFLVAFGGLKALQLERGSL